MGVINVTPDSFSDGGRFLDSASAIAHGEQLAREGADLVDVGGESTRPGAEPVDAATEIARVVPVIRGLAARLRIPIAIDTCKAAVAEAALQAGAEVVNDVSGGRLDPRILDVAARAEVPLIVGHLRGLPATMQRGIAFHDLFAEVAEELELAIAAARAAGVAQIIADPGIGFGKTVGHNLALLRRAGELSLRLGVPVMVGPSRKAFLGALTLQPLAERLAPTLGAVVAAAMSGADFVRVHDVAAARLALAVADAVRLQGEDGEARPFDELRTGR
ncbi:MAG: dihydropteroate synthase [Myxococcales bacterium]|nr:dihydropteroate synthase [Myxococcales bacterium]